MEDFFKVGTVTTTHGVKGEVKVYPTTDDVKRFKKAKELILDLKGTRNTVKVNGVKFFKQFVILKFEGIDDCDAALKLRNADLYVSRENAVKCDKDEYFIADLYGVKVVDEKDTALGVISEIYQTGANDVYEIKREDGTTFLIPAIKECILEVNLEDNIMKIHLMDGLID